MPVPADLNTSAAKEQGINDRKFMVSNGYFYGKSPERGFFRLHLKYEMVEYIIESNPGEESIVRMRDSLK